MSSTSRVNHPRECAICMEDLSGFVSRTKCGHVYHYNCLKNWLNGGTADGGGASSSRAGEGADLAELSEEQQVQQIIDLTRDEVGVHHHLCPICRVAVDEDELTMYIGYENKFANADEEGLTEDEKRSYEKKLKANKKRADRRRRNRKV